jgi:hypothetical protein
MVSKLYSITITLESRPLMFAQLFNWSFPIKTGFAETSTPFSRSYVPQALQQVRRPARSFVLNEQAEVLAHSNASCSNGVCSLNWKPSKPAA